MVFETLHIAGVFSFCLSAVEYPVTQLLFGHDIDDFAKVPKQARELHATVLLDVLQWNLTVSAPVYAEIGFQNPIDFKRISTKAGHEVHI